MASELSTVQFLAEQISSAGEIIYKKMFGEYLIYCNEKPIFLICDDTLYIKMLPEIEPILKTKETGYPYNGAKPHYIIDDIEDSEYLTALAIALDKLILKPKPKRKKVQ